MIPTGLFPKPTRTLICFAIAARENGNKRFTNRTYVFDHRIDFPVVRSRKVIKNLDRLQATQIQKLPLEPSSRLPWNQGRSQNFTLAVAKCVLKKRCITV